MKQMGLSKAAIATSAFACAALFSFGWSEQGDVSLSIESAQARVGRPLTPVSVAGVARRQNRRAAYGAGVVGAGVVGAAAVGTAAATQPWGWGGGTGWGWGGAPYVGAGALGARAAYYGGGPYTGAGYYGGRPYVGTGAVAAQAAYYGGGPGWGGGSYAPACTPGTLYIAADGLVQMCK
jgi:hypothetical protein